jgi:hypothetical protein
MLLKLHRSNLNSELARSMTKQNILFCDWSANISFSPEQPSSRGKWKEENITCHNKKRKTWHCFQWKMDKKVS